MTIKQQTHHSNGILALDHLNISPMLWKRISDFFLFEFEYKKPAYTSSSPGTQMIKYQKVIKKITIHHHSKT